MSEMTVKIINQAQAFSAGIKPAIFIGPTGKTPELAIGTVVSGQAASATITGTVDNPVLNLVLPIGPMGPVGPQGPKGDTGATGAKGDTGNGIASFGRTSGTGAPGSTDIYTLTMTDGTTGIISIYIPRDGRDGDGAGDMLLSIYDPDGDGKVVAAERADKAGGLDSAARITTAQVIGLDDVLAGKAAADHNHDGVYQPKGDYAPADHGHDGVYQPVGEYATVQQLDAKQSHLLVADIALNADLWTLDSADTGDVWQQTVDVPDLMASQSFFATYATASKAAYLAAGVSALDTTEDGKITFVADDQPSADIIARITYGGGQGGGTGGGGIPEAPTDGKIYGRKNANWTLIPEGVVPLAWNE